MPRFLTIILLAFVLFGVSACGFTPLYATKAQSQSVKAKFAAIDIAPIKEPGIAGFMLQKNLERRFGGGATPEFDLLIKLKESRASVAVTGEANTTRFSYTLSARYKLTHRASEKAITGTLSAVTGYGIVPSQYSSLVGEEEARRKSVQDLAERLELELALALHQFDE